MKAAIFDLDGTLFSLSGERRFIPWLVVNLRFNPFRVIPYIWRSLKDRDFFSTKLYYRGYDSKKIRAYAKEYFSPQRIRRIIFPDALREIEERRKEGAFLVLLTGAPDFIAENFKVLGFEKIVASVVEEKDGKFTGELIEYPSGKRKREIVEDLAKQYGIMLGESYGYGNSSADAHFLSLLGNPVAVNPSRKLKEIALRNGWRVEYWNYSRR